MNADESATVPSVISIVEAILFASDRPVTVEELRRAIPESDEDTLLGALDELEQEYLGSETRGVVMQSIAGGYQLTTRPEVGFHVERFLVGKRRARLSRAALETLATIAYRQPITRGDIEELRGVDSGHVVHRLLERDLITVRGRSQALGRPLFYGTTTEFLRFFGVSSLSDLPALEEFEALSSEDPLDDPEIREALEQEGLWSEDEGTEAETLGEQPAEEGTGPSDAAPLGAGPGVSTTNGNGHGPSNGNGGASSDEVSADEAAVTSGVGQTANDGNGNGNGNGSGNGNGNGSSHTSVTGNGHGDGHPAGDEGGDERTQVERTTTGGGVPETAVSAELEPPSFGDDEEEYQANVDETFPGDRDPEDPTDREVDDSEASAKDGSETLR